MPKRFLNELDNATLITKLLRVKAVFAVVKGYIARVKVVIAVGGDNEIESGKILDASLVDNLAS